MGNDVREYVDQSSELLGKHFHSLPFAFLKDNGNFVAHTPFSMVSQPLNDLPEPKQTSNAVTKKYVDDLIVDNVADINGGGGSPFFKENGKYRATHVINMAFKKLLKLSTPLEPFEAATKEYVDDVKEKVDDVKKMIDEKSHIIAVHASYHGKLIKDKYQLSFGGSTINPNSSSGFLVPHSGRIKTIKLKTPYYGKKVGIDDVGEIIEGTFFTIVAIKNTGEVSNLERYECLICEPSHSGYRPKVCSFDLDPTNMPISEGDVINIRTGKDFRVVEHEGKFPPVPYLFTFF